VVEAVRVEDPSEAAAFDIKGPFTRVEFNVQLVSTEKPELQVRHERNRALEADLG
jgi:catechol 1,2-dioxygenase